MKDNKNSVVITSAARTVIGSFKGSLSNLQGHELGAIAIQEVLKRSKIKPIEIDEVIMGQVLTGGAGQNPARQAAIKSGIPVNKTAYVVNQVCGSGLRSIVSGYQAILNNDANIVVAGGQESMTNASHAIDIRKGKKLFNSELQDIMIYDGLWDAFYNYHMGITAENVADKWKISRDDQDNFAFMSQSKAQKAIQDKKFEEEIIKVAKLIQDEYPRKDVTKETLSRLKPVFKKDGTVTAGNSSGINDGAAAVILMTEKEANKRNLIPMGRIVSWVTCGVDPSVMGTGPIPASKKALEKANWSVEDLDLVEANEAFASQSIVVARELKIPIEKVNVNGGAIALGHPIGTSGTRIVVTLLHEMKKRNAKRGLATLCIGGGMGIAMCIERKS